MIGRLKKALSGSGAKTTYDGIKCVSRKYTLSYLAFYFIVLNIFFFIYGTVTGSSINILSMFLVSGLALAVVIIWYLLNLEQIKKELTRTVHILIQGIHRLRPENPGEQLEVKDLECDDELQCVVVALNKKSVQIQRHIDYLKKLIGYLQHEFNTPLAITQLHLDRLKKKQLYDEEHILSIQDEVTHMGGLVESIITLMSAEAEVQKMETCDVVEMTEIVTTQLSQLFPEQNINVHAENASVKVSTNRHALRAILRNLIENACKYGGSDIDIYITDKKIRVTDSGGGIDSENLENIWLPFWKVDKSRTDQPGFGLGLSLVRQLVEKLSRNIDVASISGVSTTFTLTYS